VSRLSFRSAEQQPEAFSERIGKKDTRGAYGLHAREMILWLNQLQHARDKNVIFVGVLEWAVDDFKRGQWQLQCEGSKTSRELAIVEIEELISDDLIDDAGQSRQCGLLSAPTRINGTTPPKIEAGASRPDRAA
jgi:hypothetical protein